MTKSSALRSLARKRQATVWPGYSALGDYHDGLYECDFVSPYTKGAQNLDADIFILLQDWASDDWLKAHNDAAVAFLGRAESLSTNRTLEKLLVETFSVALAQTYATNLFPFVKKGRLSARIPFKDLVRAATEYALPQIRVVQPKLVICLGLNTFNAVRVACGYQQAPTLAQAISAPFSIDSARVWCQAHTGSLGQLSRNRATKNQTIADWIAMKHDAVAQQAVAADGDTQSRQAIVR